MKNETGSPNGSFGLLASGSSGHWELAVDESLEREEWSLEIEGPQTYLVFKLRALEVLDQALQFLQSDPQRGRGKNENAESSLLLGRFGSASVSLMWDNENVPRCFIVVGPKSRSTLRLSLDAPDIKMLIDALRQVLQDIPQVVGK